MGYLKIPNLYKAQEILQFKECYALEKVHGTSAHIGWDAASGNVHFFSGEQQAAFESLFDVAKLTESFIALGHEKLTVYGEAYGGKIQGMSKVYGPTIKFVVFDVKHDERWLCVPEAYRIASSLGMRFVWFDKIPANLSAIDCARDLDSHEADLAGMGSQIREGVVLRPVYEFIDHRGNRVIAKHKRDEFKETRTKREVSADKIEVLAKAEAIAEEWVTDMRAKHILGKWGKELTVENTGEFIREMVNDVVVEAGEEIVDSKDARKAIGTAAARIYKKHLQSELGGVHAKQETGTAATGSPSPNPQAPD